MLKRVAIALVLIAAAPAAARERPTPVLTAEHFRQTATLHDDDLELVATISTQPGDPPGHGMKGVLPDSDNFLRAFVEKATGKVHFQLYQWVIYKGGARRYSNANFVIAGKLQSRELRQLGSQVETCYGAPYPVCQEREDVALDLSPDEVQAIAAQQGIWRYRLKGASTDDWDDEITPAEAEGLLAAVDAYRAAHGLRGPLEDLKEGHDIAP